jgi:hypothetical protein
MAIVALITWIITAGFGFFMLSVWLRNGGTQTRSHFAPPMVFGHFGLAAAGLVVWIIYVFVDLLVVATLGDLLVLRWYRDRKVVSHSVGSMSSSTSLAEQQIPTPVVAVHGIFAVTTLVLVFLAALGVGGS